MKKSSKSVRTNELMIDVIEYTFIEWLVRRGIFSAFKENYKHAYSPYRTFRDHLRSHIRHVLHGFGIGPSHLISSAFMFSSTPEGVKFWGEQSAAWERFCSEFQVKL